MRAENGASSSTFMPSPLLRHYENVCVHIAYKGSMTRQGYAWFMGPSGAKVSRDDASGMEEQSRQSDGGFGLSNRYSSDESASVPLPRASSPLPDPPLFSRHVEFIASGDALAQVRPWWKDSDINRTITHFGVSFTTRGSNLTAAVAEWQRNMYAVRVAQRARITKTAGRVTWLPNASWFIDVSHGGAPNQWENICHFSNSVWPFFEAAYLNQALKKPLQRVMLWQVQDSTDKLGETGFHGGLLRAVVRSVKNRVSPTRLLLDDDILAGDTLCFEEIVVAREPNLAHRRAVWQTRASMTGGGVARGFGTDEVRFAFRAAVLGSLRVDPPALRMPTITYLSRPLKEDDEAHGPAWQLRCHVSARTFRKLKAIVAREAGLDLKRVVFERTSYAYQAKVISETDIFWAAHGAGLVHIPLLPPRAVVVEMFNCGHYSYLYSNLALRLRIKYFAMQRPEAFCTRPQALLADSRLNLTQTYAFSQAEAEPVLMQAARYWLWQDPGPSITGREPFCEYIQKTLALTGVLPAHITPQAYTAGCAQASRRRGSAAGSGGNGGGGSGGGGSGGGGVGGGGGGGNTEYVPGQEAAALRTIMLPSSNMHNNTVVETPANARLGDITAAIPSTRAAEHTANSDTNRSAPGLVAHMKTPVVESATGTAPGASAATTSRQQISSSVRRAHRRAPWRWPIRAFEMRQAAMSAASADAPGTYPGAYTKYLG